MGHRINVVIDDSVWMELQKVPQGERGRLISDAVSKELLRRGRRQAVGKMDVLRKTRRVGAGPEEMVRADRDAHW